MVVLTKIQYFSYITMACMLDIFPSIAVRCDIWASPTPLSDGAPLNICKSTA
jgi:hypothetical protein